MVPAGPGTPLTIHSHVGHTGGGFDWGKQYLDYTVGVSATWKALTLDASKTPTQRRARLLRPLGAEYDLIVLDCPPSISLLSESVLHAADILLVPLIPTTLSVRTLDQLTEFIAGFDGHRPEVLAFCSMIDRRKRLHREIAERLPAERPDVARTIIPALSLIERMSLERAPVTAFAPRSAAARQYAALWAEVAERGL